MEQFIQIFELIGSWAEKAWRFRVASIDGNEITIANIVIALVVLVVGIRLSRKGSKLLINRAFKKAKISSNARVTLQTLIFYIMIAVFIFISLGIAQIPIQAFAVLGGALAIGVGFGSQNLIKDFISGLILMIEQPVRVDDMIEIDSETRGKIIRIGAISTHIRTFRNVDILVPNSYLVESNVINWTLTDQYARRTLRVGVAYGSPTRKVAELIKQAVDAHERVISERGVEVYFINFGDNTLDFEVFFWIKMTRPGNEREVTSDIRHTITEIFEENNITIAFPQRDVHLDTLSPVEVKVVNSGSG